MMAIAQANKHPSELGALSICRWLLDEAAIPEVD